MSALSSLPLLPGLKVEGVLGKGGMGTVYRAMHLRLGRTVAVKVLAGHLARDPAFVERFLREARYLARVRHDRLVTIYDVVTAGAVPYFVMEYVAGKSLATHLAAKGRLDWREARPLLEDVLQAVEAMHAQGLVHRDLKPGNILLDAEGRPKVMDFGLAKGPGDAALTQEGVILGTPEYMAPEQAKGDAAGPPADVYALGVIAFQALSGRLPFRGASTVATLRMHCQDPLPPLDGVSPEVADWVARALAKTPAERFADAGAMRRALSGGEGSDTTRVSAPSAPPPSVPLRTVWPWVMGGGAAALLVLLLLWKPWARRPPRATFTSGGRRVSGRLLGIAPTSDGGHRVRLQVGRKEEVFELKDGEEASLELEKAP